MNDWFNRSSLIGLVLQLDATFYDGHLHSTDKLTQKAQNNNSLEL